MSEFKHTPGPWTQATMGPNGCPIVGSGALMVAMIAHSTNEPEQAEEAKANARLIAAAPELLEALQEVFSDADKAKSLQWINKVAYVIAKATGGTNDH